MAQQHHDTHHDAQRAHERQSRGRSGTFYAIAAILLILSGGIAYVALSEDPVEGQLEDSPLEDARPVGAGTFPDGEADAFQEGLGNETDQSDFIAPGAPTDATPNPLMDVPDGDAPTVNSIDELEPGPAVDDEVLERMAPNDN